MFVDFRSCCCANLLTYLLTYLASPSPDLTSFSTATSPNLKIKLYLRVHRRSENSSYADDDFRTVSS